MQNQKASDVKQRNKKNNRSQTEYPSATMREEMTNPYDLNQKISRLKPTCREKFQSQDSLFCRNGGNFTQTNSRFERAEKASKGSDKV